MVITNMLVTGSIAYASVKTVVAHHRAERKSGGGKESAYTVQQAPTHANATATTMERGTGVPTLQARRQRTAAATAMWLGVGGLFWSPLALVGVPLTIYSALPIFEAAGESLYSKGQFRPSVINSILLVSTLVTKNYLPAATISWLHHSFKQLGEQLQAAGEGIATEMEQDLGDLLRQATGGSPKMVWIVQKGDSAQRTEIKIPFTDLKSDDILVANQGELIPVNGVVVDGEATLNLLLLTQSGAPVSVRAGDRIYKGAYVSEGQLWIQVDPIQ